jgi:hypothetical protein
MSRVWQHGVGQGANLAGGAADKEDGGWTTTVAPRALPLNARGRSSVLAPSRDRTTQHLSARKLQRPALHLYVCWSATYGCCLFLTDVHRVGKYCLEPIKEFRGVTAAVASPRNFYFPQPLQTVL